MAEQSGALDREPAARSGPWQVTVMLLQFGIPLGMSGGHVLWSVMEPSQQRVSDGLLRGWRCKGRGGLMVFLCLRRHLPFWGGGGLIKLPESNNF